MKWLLIASVTTVAAATAAEARKAEQGARQHAKTQHSYTKRDYDRKPISVTRPPNTSHYTYQDLPLWAARAFQPPAKR